MIFTSEILTSAEQLKAVGPAWNALWHRTGADIFQRFEWISTWAEQVSSRRDISLLIAVAWHADRLVAVIPCSVRRRHGVRSLEWAADTLTDYCDALVEPSPQGRQAQLECWDRLQRAGAFDLVLLRQIRPDAAFHSILRANPALSARDRKEECYHVRNEWPDGEAYFRSLGKKGRNNHLRGKRILADLGGDIAFCAHTAPQDAAQLLDQTQALKRAWLSERHPDSPLLQGDDAVLRAVLDAVLPTGLVAIFALHCGGKPTATSVNFVYQNKMQAYLTAYDPRYERASPGTILIVEYTKWAFDRGLQSVDFLRGDEPFKLRLANGVTILQEFVGNRTFKGRVAIAARRLQQRLTRSNPVPVSPEADMGA